MPTRKEVEEQRAREEEAKQNAQADEQKTKQAEAQDEASKSGQSSEDGGASEGDRPAVAGAVLNPTDEHQSALDEHDADPQGSAAADASEVTTVAEEIQSGVHVQRGPDGRLHQVAQLYTNF